MAWSTPKTWSDTLDRLNAANLNRYIRDNQLALRADHAALAQRVAQLEVSGYSASSTFEVSYRSANQRINLDFTPPQTFNFLEMTFRTDRFDQWVVGPKVDYEDWIGLPALGDGDPVNPGTEIQFRVLGDVNSNIQGGVGRTAAGKLWVSIDSGDSSESRPDRIRVRVYS